MSHPTGTEPVLAGVDGILLRLEVEAGDRVSRGQTLAVIESMKMEFPATTEIGGIVRGIVAEAGAEILAAHPIAYVEPAVVEEEAAPANPDPAGEGGKRADLAALRERRAIGADESRAEAVARRHATGHATARENIAALVDPGSFSEYGELALAAQRNRRSREELLEISPADGLIAGLARVDGRPAMVLAYDWSVLAGTQGVVSHRKAERLFDLAARLRLPLVLFGEGGGGRPGDERLGPTGFDMTTFTRFARLSGKVPLIGIASRYCFAGNAALLGCCDAVIATADACIGMGGPAMVEAGGLGRPAPAEIGPATAGASNGVVDLLVEDDEAAIAAARQYLSYFQGDLQEWKCADQELLRGAVPENRSRAYDVRALVHLLADRGSVLELRRQFGPSLLTALIRVEGRSIGLIASDPRHLGGAIDADSADKAARFMRLCDVHGLPILSLCDTPGFMVGPEIEAEAQVRHCSRLFVVGANLRVPLLGIVLRKAYGLGAQGLLGGSFQAPLAVLSWPTGEFGGMSPEGYVRLAFRSELEQIEDDGERATEFERRVAEIYARGSAINLAEHFEIDDVIDPAESRWRILRALESLPPRAGGAPDEVNAWVDPW